MRNRLGPAPNGKKTKVNKLVRPHLLQEVVDLLRPKHRVLGLLALQRQRCKLHCTRAAKGGRQKGHRERGEPGSSSAECAPARPSFASPLPRQHTSVRGEAGAVHCLVEHLDRKQEGLLQVAALLVLLLEDALCALRGWETGKLRRARLLPATARSDWVAAPPPPRWPRSAPGCWHQCRSQASRQSCRWDLTGTAESRGACRVP